MARGHVRTIDRAMLNSIFTDDKPERQRLRWPMCRQCAIGLRRYDPIRHIRGYVCPFAGCRSRKNNGTCLNHLRGKHDGIATMEDLTSFFVRLPYSDKQVYGVLPGSAHIVLFGLNARRFYHIPFAFVEMPARRDRS